MNEAMLEKYARLVVKTGINIQKGQTIVITSPLECAFFVRIAAQIAYQEGARDVVVNWRDELLTKIRFIHAPEEVFDEFPQWQKELYLSNALEGAAFLYISASDPELMKDVNPDRMTRSQKAGNIALKEYRERTMSNKNAWAVVSIPTKSWAKKVFPGLIEEEAVDRLWEAILKTVRVDAPDPVAAWEEHKQNLKKKLNYLNSAGLKFLRYKNALGTDLEIEFSENHIWLGGSDYTPEGLEFIANMPTEEVFTLPLRTGVNGTVVSSMPLNYNGNLIEHFSLTFKDGKVVEVQAGKDQELFKRILDSDEGANFLGEVALVPYDSPISRSGILYYNTLFDENASCHLALGEAYPVCIKNGENLSRDELSRLGVNNSLIHEDFMIGTPDLEIMGITRAGKEVPVFRKGNFAF